MIRESSLAVAAADPNWTAKVTYVIKRGKGTGFAGVENALFYADNTRMLYGDGAAAVGQIVSELKSLDSGH